MHAQIERTSPRSPDELNSPFREQIREVAIDFDGLVVLKQIHDTARISVSEVILRAPGDSEELPVAVLDRIELRTVSAMPFPDQSCFVTVRLEQRSYRGMIGGQADLRVAVAKRLLQSDA